MFDCHLHCSLSVDSDCPPEEHLRRAEELGFREICFTDHYDFNDCPGRDPEHPHALFTIEDYRRILEPLRSDMVKIRLGVEFGMTPWSVPHLRELIASYPFDLVIGSVHYIEGFSPYYANYWQIYPTDGEERYLSQLLERIKLHREFDVLAHLTFPGKSPFKPTKTPMRYEDFPHLYDEILSVLAKNGQGLEINTSAVSTIGECLPSVAFVRRFRELGGEIVTVGSDAHKSTRFAQHMDEALAIAREVFGYVCTFEQRKPIFHKL